jgi:hypothetical protein
MNFKKAACQKVVACQSERTMKDIGLQCSERAKLAPHSYANMHTAISYSISCCIFYKQGVISVGLNLVSPFSVRKPLRFNTRKSRLWLMQLDV